VGDFIATWPVLEELRRREPQRRIVILGRPERAALAVAGGLADEAVDFETSGCHRLFAAEAGTEAVPAALGDAELIINFLPHPVFNANLERLARGRVISTTSFPSPGQTDRPVAQFVYEQVAEKLGWPPGAEVRPRLRLKPDAVAVERLAARFPRLAEMVAIHPGSGGPTKNWRRAGFEELAGRLVAAGVPVLWIFGPAETETASPSSAGGFNNRYNSTPSTVLSNEPLVEVARVLAGVRGYVGNDSGITHLAAAVGAAVVAIWGPTERRVWAPQGERVAVAASAAGEVTTGQVLEALHVTM
jgi:ADP-heptose:LPS heptosyltransferase